MAKKLFLVVGNGFSIDFLNHIGASSKIDVIDLFKQGAEVPWPITEVPGFLSFKYCPNLWSLGARPGMDRRAGLDLIEDIISCANIDASRTRTGGVSNQQNIYGKAYKELVQYLRFLFIYYDGLEEVSDKGNDWCWLGFIRGCVDSKEYEEIVIVSYNYDCWLERVLEENKIPFKIGSIDKNDKAKKIVILKPHGSISFIHKEELDQASYSISYERELSDGSIGDFSAKYHNLGRNHLVTALIPPAGESSRFSHTWSTQLRAEAKAKAAQMGEGDEVMVCGMSYWHVDRSELDELFNSFGSNVEISMVNPNADRTLTAVLTSSFKNFVLYPSASVLKTKKFK